MTGFAKPNDDYMVYNKKGRFYIEEEGFFSCISTVTTVLFREDATMSNFATAS